MKRFKNCLFALTLALSACGGDSPTESDTVGATASNGTDGSGGSIVGKWRYTYVASGCEETLTFSSSDNFNISALDENAGGTYTTTAITSSNRNRLVMTYVSDNGLPDCLGISDDDSNVIVTKIFQVESGALNFYSTSSSKTPDKTYQKIH